MSHVTRHTQRGIDDQGGCTGFTSLPHSLSNLACPSVTYSTCTAWAPKLVPSNKRYNFVFLAQKRSHIFTVATNPPPLPTVKFGSSKDGMGVMLKLHEYGA
jgi:hypothetical protein